MKICAQSRTSKLFLRGGVYNLKRGGNSILFIFFLGGGEGEWVGKKTKFYLTFKNSSKTLALSGENLLNWFHIFIVLG